MMFTIWIIGYLISFPIIACAWTKWVVQIAGFNSFGDIILVLGESFLCSFMWPLTLPIAILSLFDVSDRLNRRSTKIYAFLNSTFERENK